MTRNAGAGVCASCHMTRPRVQIVVNVDGNDVVPLSRGAAVCMECACKPGVSFDTDVKLKRPYAALGSFRVGKRSRHEEARTAVDIEGKTTKASGATNQDGDIVTDHWMVEQKISNAARLVVSEDTILKAAAQAVKNGRAWLLRLKLTRINMDLAVMQWDAAVGAIRAWEHEASD